MKKLLNEWRQYLKEELEVRPAMPGEMEVTEAGAEPFGEEPRPAYSSVELDSTSRDALMNNQQILEKMEEFGFQNEKCGTSDCAHHMTITMGPLKPEYGWEDGEPAELTATHLGWIDEEGGPRAMAVKVELPEGKSSKNPNPHVTVAIPEGGKPFHSNKIINWELELTLPGGPLTGTVVGGAESQKKQKPQKEKPKGQDNPVEFAKGLAAKGLPPDKIKNIIMNKFNKPEQAALGIMRGAGIG